jgi:hypothetical protein
LAWATESGRASGTSRTTMLDSSSRWKQHD